MKGKIKIVLFASFLALGSLVGCNNKSSDGNGSDGGNNNNNQGGTDIGEFDYTVDEARNKLKQLGQSSGFEISLKCVSSDSDSDDVSVENITLGFKVDTLWMIGSMAIKKNGSKSEIYSPSETVQGQFDYVADGMDDTFDTSVDSLTQMFYVAYGFESYLTKSGPTTFLGRQATKYVFKEAYATAFVNAEVIIDNDTGITLKYAAAGQDLDGNSGEGSIEVTSFKTGNQVIPPTLMKNGSNQGGNGQGGNGQGGSGEGGQGEGGSSEGGSSEGGQGEGTGEAGDPNTGEGGNTEDLSKYLVTAAQYKAVVTDMAYIKANYNVKVDYFQKDNTVSSKPVILSGTFENANGVYAVADVYTQNGVETINRKVWAPNTQHDGYYDFYNQINDGEWEKGSQPMQLSEYLLAQYIGLDVASLISLNNLNEPAYASSPYYYKNQLTVKDAYETQYTLNNVKMYFEDGLLVKLIYTLNATIYEFTYLDFGKVQVQLPDIADKTPVQHNEYLAGKQFEWSRLDKDGYTGNLVTNDEVELMQLMVYKFFNDNTYELDAKYEGHSVVEVGTFVCTVTPGESLAAVKLHPVKEYLDGVASDSTESNRTLAFNNTAHELMSIRTITSGADGVKHNVKFIYGLTEKTPTKYDPSVANPYPTETIAKYISEVVEASKDTLPELKIDGAAYIFNNGYLYISLPADMTAEQAISALVGKLTGWSYNSLYQCYLSPNKEISVYFGKNDNKVYVAIDDCEDISDVNVDDSYPSEEISALFEGLTDTLPNLVISGSEYMFLTADDMDLPDDCGGLAIFLPESVTGEQAIEYFDELLTSQEVGYSLKSIEGEPAYVSPNGEIGVMLYNAGTYIGVTLINIKANNLEPKDMIKLTLKVAYNAEYGQRVYLIGDFCNWDPSDECAIAFEWDAENQVWVAEINAVVGEEIHCKLVVAAYDDPDIDDFVIWEKEGLDNEREFTIPNQNTTVDLVWGRY